MSISAFSSVARHRKSEMNCDDCEQGIEGTNFEVNGGKPVCAKCYEVKISERSFILGNLFL